MATLATSFEKTYNGKPGPQLETGSVNCISTGDQTASCMGTIAGDGGQQHGQSVQITQDGSSWMTLGN